MALPYRAVDVIILLPKFGPDNTPMVIKGVVSNMNFRQEYDSYYSADPWGQSVPPIRRVVELDLTTYVEENIGCNEWKLWIDEEVKDSDKHRQSEEGSEI